MAKTLSDDLRERVIAAIRDGASCREAAKRFGVSASSAVKWWQRWRERGSVAPDRRGKPPGRKLAPHRAWILAMIEAQPDLTLAELRRRLAEQDILVGYGSLWRLLDDEGISFKKKPCCPPSRSVRTSLEPEATGGNASPPSMPTAWSSSMRPGPRPT